MQVKLLSDQKFILQAVEIDELCQFIEYNYLTHTRKEKNVFGFSIDKE